MTEVARTELVAVAWVKSIPEIATNGMVATQLPQDNTSWATSGFIVCGPVVGGTPLLYAPVREPVVQVSTYGVNPNSQNPDWAKAEKLANQVIEATYNGALLHTSLILRASVSNATVMSAAALTEPARLEDDPSGYAIYTLDLGLTWKEVT